MSEVKKKHSKWLHIRLKEEEYNRIHKKFEASTCRKLSEYARRVLLDKVVTVNQRNQSLDDFMTEMIRLRNELHSIGNNFNQAVKKLHTLQKTENSSNFRQMVAIVHNSGSLRNALHYNENKVKQKVAECIHSANYPKDTEWLSFKDKIHRLEKLTMLNQQTKINSVHISLNFDPSEQLNKDVLKEIAEVYMQKIGFGEQPY